MRKSRTLLADRPLDAVPARVVFGSLEGLLTSEWGFGLTTATPVQRAVCHTLDTGQIPDELWAVPEVKLAFGNIRPTEFRDEFMMVCGIRGAKTKIAAATCVWKALTMDFSQGAASKMGPGEIPRASLVSRHEEQAQVAFQYIVGAVTNSEILKHLMIGLPTADAIMLRHPSGRAVEVKVVAMSTAGTNLVARWCIVCVFDEAPRMASEDEGKVNLEAQVKAVRFRVLKGGLIMYIGSPLGAKGYVYEKFSKNWESPTQSLYVVKADARWLNPTAWDPEDLARLERDAPDVFESDILANFIDPETQLFPTATIESITRESPLSIPYDPAKKYSATMDPAMSVNAWTLVIGETDDNRFFRVAFAYEWRGSTTEPLSTKAVLKEVKEFLDLYHIQTVTSDQYAFGPIKDLALDLGFGVSELVFTSANKKKLYMNLRTRAVSGLLELPPIPEMKRDLQNVKKRFSRGEFVIDLVETSDGRHCDFAPALAILCGGYLEANAAPAEPQKATNIALMSGDELEELEDRLAERDWLYDDGPLDRGMDAFS